MKTPIGTPKYLIPNDDPIIENWRADAEAAASGQNTGIFVEHDAILDGNAVALLEFILTLQHFPEALQKLLFRLHLVFQIPGTQDAYGDDDWIDVIHIRWLNGTFTRFAFSIFFIDDPKARFFSIMGDCIQSSDVEKISRGQYDEFLSRPNNLLILSARLTEACRYFRLYCYGTGVDPKEFILQLIQETGARLTWEALEKAYQEDIPNIGSFGYLPFENN